MNDLNWTKKLKHSNFNLHYLNKKTGIKMSDIDFITISKFDKKMLLVKKNLLAFFITVALLTVGFCIISIQLYGRNSAFSAIFIMVWIIFLIVFWHIYAWWDDKFQFRSNSVLENPPELDATLKDRIGYWVRNHNSGNGLDHISGQVVDKIYSGLPLNRKECVRLVEVMDMYSYMETHRSNEAREKLTQTLAPLREKLIVLSKALEVEDNKILKWVEFRIKNEALVETDDVAAKQYRLTLLATVAAIMSAIAAIFSAIAAFKNCH